MIWCQQNLCSQKLVFQHLREDHRSTDLNNGLRCKMDNCFKSFSSYHAYRMHLQRNHLVCSDNAAGASLMFSNDASFEESDLSIGDSFQETDFHEETDENQLQTFQKHFAELYMLCREKYVLPVSTVLSIMSKVVSLFVKFETGHVEKHNPVTTVEFELLWKNLHKESYYRRFCGSAGLVAPREVQINDFSFQYVPLLSILPQYLSHADVLSSVSYQCGTDRNVSSNCMHGSFLKENAFFKGNKDLQGDPKVTPYSKKTIIYF